MISTRQRRKNKKRVSLQKRQPKRVQKEATEVSNIGKALRALGGMGGSALGGLVGLPHAGSGVGNSLGAALSKWLGFGDYEVASNSIVQRASTGIPMMHKEGQSVVIRHREFIAQVRGSQLFNVQDSFQINPGNRKTFPWLATIANSFQEYRFKGLVFHYIPSSGNAVASTNAALGTVMLQTSYRSNDSPPASKSELLNEYWSGEAVPNETFVHPIECDPNENPFNVQYVRSGDIPSNDSQLLYDLGVTHLCTSGQQADGFTLGDVWVTYEVELKKPIVASNVTSPLQLSSARFATPTNTALFAGVMVERGNIEILGSPTINQVTLGRGLRGQYIVDCMILPNSTFSGYPVGTLVITLSNATAIRLGPSPSDPTVVNTFAAATTNGGNMHISFAFEVIDPTVVTTFSFPALALIGVISSVLVDITPYG